MIRRRRHDPSSAFASVSPTPRLPFSLSPALPVARSPRRLLEKRGRLVARILNSSWSSSPAPLDFTESELASITSQLYQSGEAALAWWRIRSSELAGTATGLLLRDAYRHLRLAARLHEREIKNVFALLRAEGIEPVLVKGWASARMYPDAALRPYGDIDLCVRPDQFAQAAAAIRRVQTAAGPFVDLHDGFASIGREARGPRAEEGGRPLEVQGQATKQAFRVQTSVCLPNSLNQAHQLSSKLKLVLCAPVSSKAHADSLSRSQEWNDLFSRSRLVSLSDEYPDDQIRILSDEDHLRIICLHLLQSGGWRPLWLCDVAVALENISDDFDWTTCLGQDQRQAEWIAATLALAADLLLGNNGLLLANNEHAALQAYRVQALACRAPTTQPGVQGHSGKLKLELYTPVANSPSGRLPTAHCPLPTAHWFSGAVLRHWGRVRPADQRAMHLGQLLLSGLSVGQMIGEVYARWDNPVRATVNLRGRFTGWPRLPYQLGELLLRAPELPRQLLALALDDHRERALILSAALARWLSGTCYFLRRALARTRHGLKQRRDLRTEPGSPG